MNPRLLEISKTRYNWYNATRNVTATPLRYFYPQNVEDIQAIVSEAEQENLRVRAVGSGHSFSEAAKGDDFLMDMKELRQAEVYKAPWVKASLSQKHFVLADAGITIRRINRLLDSMGLALQNMGAVDFQTVSGALMTGTHGTGIKKPAFPDMVRSLRIVATDSKLIQIEPTDGITDPNYHQQHSNITLIQDDDIFYSTVLSFGGMGIVYQIVFEVVPPFWIHEHRYLDSWTNVQQQLRNGQFLQKVDSNDFVAFRVNPYKIDGDHLCSVVVQNILSEPPSPWEKGRRRFLGTLIANREALIESVIRSANRKPERTAKKIQTSLKYSKIKNYRDKSYKVFYQSGAAVLRYGISSEFAFPTEGPVIADVLERIFKETAYAAAYADRYHSSHIPVRFVMPSKVYLASTYQQPKAYIDIPTLYGTQSYQDLLENYQLVMIGMGGVPHWGKVNNMLYLNQNKIVQFYPKVNTWKQVRDQMDPKRTFVSDFIIKMGLV